MKYKQKPPTVEAMKFDGSNADEIQKMAAASAGEDQESLVYAVDGTALLIQQPHGGVILVPKGDYLLVEQWGGLRAVSADKFEAEFEAA